MVVHVKIRLLFVIGTGSKVPFIFTPYPFVLQILDGSIRLISRFFGYSGDASPGGYRSTLPPFFSVTR